MRRIEMGSFAASMLCMLGSGAMPSGIAIAAAQPVFRLASPDLPAGKLFREEFVANDFGCHGGNHSPALHWSGAPPGTKSFAVTMYDPYKPPQSGWWHWIVYDLPASTAGLAQDAGNAGGTGLPAGARQGTPDGDAPQAHYYGPCPDVGDPPHHYVITVYALSVDHLDLPPTATAADVDYTITGKMIGKASITRSYQRPSAGAK
jgi:hypothetical protein